MSDVPVIVWELCGNCVSLIRGPSEPDDYSLNPEWMATTPAMWFSNVTALNPAASIMHAKDS